jgi:hypothetical protein
MYFVWRSNAALSKKYMYVRDDPPELDQGDWITGKPMLTKPPVMTMTGKESSPSAPSDIVLGGFNLPVLSPRAIAVLDRIGVDNLEYFSIRLRNWETGAIDQSYKIANVLGLVNCLDRNHATYNVFPDDETKISWLQKYRILEDRIPSAGRGKKPLLLFRLGEFPYHVLAHESVKAAFEGEGLTGSKFVPPEMFA